LEGGEFAAVVFAFEKVGKSIKKPSLNPANRARFSNFLNIFQKT
jgi:hypothetical protein